MTPTVTAHAALYPPSSAARYMACPGSVNVIPLYPREESEHSEKGDTSHDALNTAIVFGVPPHTPDPDMNENLNLVLDWLREMRREYGPQTQVFSELRMDIPETGEFGTTDICIVAPFVIHIVDFKNGYVPVNVTLNKQLMTYLLGAIAKFGTRPSYKITVCQPNYFHINGPIRTYVVTNEQVEAFRAQTIWAVGSREYIAGKHCKDTWCPHRGNCVSFLQWATTNAADAWFPSEVHALTDEALIQAADHADILHGIRQELRKEIMRRILQQNKNMRGYKMVTGRLDRQFKDIDAVHDICVQLGATDDDLYDKRFTTVAGVERFIKRLAEPMGRGEWKKLYERLIKPHVRDFQAGLTLERAIDGRPAHRRGSEFGPLQGAPQLQQQRTVV